MISLFDLHCDTLYELYKKNLDFDNTQLHINSKSSKLFSPYVQVCAIWSDYRLTNDECFENYKKCLAYTKQLGFDFHTALPQNARSSFVLSIEDARLLNNSISRLDRLYVDGIRSLTLNWKGYSCIGGGWDTSIPLTDFGLQVVLFCIEKGIAVDLSHSSKETQRQVIKLTEKYNFAPFYSHSNSYSVCNHERNITDDLAKEISSLNGLIGLSVCPDHLSFNKKATVYSLVSHAYHFLELGCEGCLALGCDFDGVTSLPVGISGISDLSKLYAIFSKEFGKRITERIFYKNSLNYFSNLFEGR